MDIAEYGCNQTPKQITVFDTSVKREANSPFTQTIDLAGVSNIILRQKTTKQANTTTRTITSVTGWSSGASAVDDDLTSSTGSYNGAASGVELIVDFGSSASRTVKAKGRVKAVSTGGSGQRTANIKIEFSTSSSGPWVDTVTIAQSSYNENGVNIPPNTTATISTTPASAFRYGRIFASVDTGSTNVDVECYEVYRAGEGLGTSTLTLEFYDTTRAEWSTLYSNFTTMDASGTNGTSETKMIGVNSSNFVVLGFDDSLLRAKLTVVDGVNTSVDIIGV